MITKSTEQPRSEDRKSNWKALAEKCGYPFDNGPRFESQKAKLERLLVSIKRSKDQLNTLHWDI